MSVDIRLASSSRLVREGNGGAGRPCCSSLALAYDSLCYKEYDVSYSW